MRAPYAQSPHVQPVDEIIDIRRYPLADPGSHGWVLYYAGSIQKWSLYSSHTTTAANALSAAITSNSGLGQNTWTHIVGVVNAGVPSLYINGASAAASTTNAVGTYVSSLSNAAIGDSPDFTSGAGLWSGLIDEVRISNTARSAAWITTEYNNQGTPSSFVTVGGQESQ